MKKAFASILIFALGFVVFSQKKTNLIIRPGLMIDTDYETAREWWQEDGEQDYGSVVSAYDGLRKLLRDAIDKRMMDVEFDEEHEESDGDFNVTVNVRKPDSGEGYVFYAEIKKGSVFKKKGECTVKELNSKDVAENLASQLCPSPEATSIALYRVDEYAKLVWAVAKTDVKSDVLEYKVVKSPLKNNLTDTNTAIKLARQQDDEWKTEDNEGLFSEIINLGDDFARNVFFTVIVRNSLGCYSAYPVRECQSVMVSTLLGGQLSFELLDSNLHEEAHGIEIGGEDKKDIMLSVGEWKIKLLYADSTKDEKSITLKADGKKQTVSFDYVNEDFIREKYNQGLDFRQKKKIDDSITALKFAADNQNFPHSGAMYELACIYEEKNNKDKALEYYIKAMENGSIEAKERLVDYYQGIVNEYDKIPKDIRYRNGLGELKNLLSDSGDVKRISEINKKISVYDGDEATAKKNRAKELEKTDKNNPNYRYNLVVAQTLWNELGNTNKVNEIGKRIKDYDKNQKVEMAKKLEDTKEGPEYVENLEKAKRIWGELGDEKKVQGISKRINDYQKKLADEKQRTMEWENFVESFCESQRHRTVISLGLDWRSSPVYRHGAEPAVQVGIPLDFTFGIWPNFFVGLSGELDTFPYYYNSHMDYDSSYNADAKMLAGKIPAYWTQGKNDWFGGSLLAVAGLNVTLWKHINLYALVGGGFWSLSNNNIGSWTSGKLRAGIGFDWIFWYDDYMKTLVKDDRHFGHVISMSAEYDVDYSFNKGVEDCFKIGVTFYWDTPRTSGWIPSFYNDLF